MNRLMISGFVAVALLAAAITMLPSYSLLGYRAAATTGTASSQQRQTSTVVNKLPIEEFEDMSLVLFDSAQALKRDEDVSSGQELCSFRRKSITRSVWRDGPRPSLCANKTARSFESRCLAGSALLR